MHRFENILYILKWKKRVRHEPWYLSERNIPGLLRGATSSFCLLISDKNTQSYRGATAYCDDCPVICTVIRESNQKYNLIEDQYFVFRLLRHFAQIRLPL